MTDWPTTPAIIAATCGNSARDAERRAKLAAIDATTQFVVHILVLLPTKHRRRFALAAFCDNFEAKTRAAHEAIGA
jgi:hypothetical protein